MAVYWASCFFAFLWTEKKSRSIKTQKKNEANIYALLTKLVRSRWLFAGPKRVISSGQDGPILPARVANQNTGFASSCPLVIFKINRSKLIFVHLILLDACNNQCFIIASFCKVNELCKARQAIFFSAGPKRAIPSGQDRPILPARVANQNTGFASSYPLAEPAIY